MAQTVKPREVARQASKVAGRTVTDKQVRGIARDRIARFDKDKHPAYQSHEYTATEVRTILAVFAARAGRKVAPVRKPRTTTARKTTAAPTDA
jgi:hypothetical protein